MHALAEEAPHAQVVMLTVSEDADDLLDALHAGAHGYLLKNIDSDFLVRFDPPRCGRRVGDVAER